MTYYRTHPQYLALLQSVLAAPCDDLPREVLADWLDEHGRWELAEFINVQCKLAKVPPEPEMKCSGMVFNSHRAARQHSETCQWCRWVGEHRDTSAPLRRREKELWGTPGFVDKFTSLTTCVLADPAGTQFRLGTEYGPLLTVRRGFVASVRCRLVDWFGVCEKRCGRCSYVAEHPWEDRCPSCHSHHPLSFGFYSGIGPRLVREHPVERVLVVDRVAANIDRPMKFAWHTATEWRNVPHHIPPAVWSNLKGGERCANCPYCWGYPTLDDAESALSAALIAWAKGQPFSRA